MGCACFKTKGHGDNSKGDFKPGDKSHQGVHELKLNYKISAQTKVLGAGSFGKVFLSENIADPSFKVAIKVLNKAKLKDNI